MLELLAPLHDQAQATGRRLCRTSGEGDDLFQESVLRAFDKLSSLRDESRFRSWFYAVLLSRHRSRVRQGFWRRLLPLEDELEQGREPVGEDGGEWEERHLMATRASRALATLPAPQREAVVLFDIDGFSVDEVAEIQKTSPSAVKSRLSRGRQKLRRFYERLGMEGKERHGDEANSLRCARSST